MIVSDMEWLSVADDGPPHRHNQHQQDGREEVPWESGVCVVFDSTLDTGDVSAAYGFAYYDHALKKWQPWGDGGAPTNPTHYAELTNPAADAAERSEA